MSRLGMAVHAGISALLSFGAGGLALVAGGDLISAGLVWAATAVICLSHFVWLEEHLRS